ncbi:MAG: PQQ-binding-like beta-propeller repeat protein [Bacteroidota bacterium]
MSTSFRLCFGLLLLLLAANAGHAQEADRNLYTTDDPVVAAVVAGDTLYIGGTFVTVAPPTGPAAVVNKATGEPDLAQARVGETSNLGEGVTAVLPDGQGGWYVAGEIEWTGGEPRRNLALVRPDGTVDPAFRPAPQIVGNPFDLGYVETLALDAGVLYVGGRFDEVGGLPRRNFAALDAETGAVLPASITMTNTGSGNTNGGPPQGTVETIVVRDGVLYLGGFFDTINGTGRGGVAALDPQTGALLPWDAGLTDGLDAISGGPSVFQIGIGPAAGETTLYLTGFFDAARGEERLTGAAEVTLADPVTGEGGAPTAWETDVELNTGDLVVTDNVLWVSTPGFTSTPAALYRISRATGAETEFFDNVYSRGRALALDPSGNGGQGVLYFGARDVSNAEDFFPSQFLLALDPATGAVLPGLFGGDRIRVAASLEGIKSLAVEPGPTGRLFVGGKDLFGVDGVRRQTLAGIDLTTGRVTDFGKDVNILSSVTSLGLSPDERFLYFETFNGIGLADLETGQFSDFAFPDARSGAGAVATYADGSPLPPLTPPAVSPEASRAATTGTTTGSRIRTDNSTLVVTEDRVYFHAGSRPLVPFIICYDRATGNVIWETFQFSTLSGFPIHELLLVEAGPPGAAGDTLFFSGGFAFVDADLKERDRFAALDAETGAVLDWNVNPTGPQQGAALAALPGEDAIYLSGFNLDVIGGVPRDNVAAVTRSGGDVLPLVPDPAASDFPGVGGAALTIQPGPGGGAAGGVVYTSEYALDAVTGDLIGDWDPLLTNAAPPVTFRPSATVLDEKRERVIMVGGFRSSLRGSGHAHLVSLTPARPFASGPDLNLTATASQTTVAPGGSVRFDYTVENNTSSPASGDLYFVAQQGQAVVAQAVVRSGTVPASQALSGSYVQQVPNNAPTGDYVYTLSIGAFPNQAVDSEVFALTVTGSSANGAAGVWGVTEATPWEDSAASRAVPGEAVLSDAFPNPSGGSVTVELSVPQAERVEVGVFDLLGRRVAVLHDGMLEAGVHPLRFDGRGLPAGVYVVRAAGSSFAEARRVTIL